MNVLVTGGAGFIGSHIVRALLERGDRVRVLDNFSTGKRENLAGLDVEVIEADLRDACTGDPGLPRHRYDISSRLRLSPFLNP